jgi:outer membrane receptor for ferrienterochelin and colicins
MKRNISVLLLTLYCSAAVFSQEKTDAMLFGDVKSASTGEHIPFAAIIVKGTWLGTTTDETGHYKLANLPVGQCVIIARSLGYKSQEKDVLMERGKATELFFELEDDALNLEQVVITGTRTEHHIKDVPVRTEVITLQEMKNKNAGNLFQALASLPGIRVEGQCQYCNFTMVRMQGLGAEHTQVLINGQPLYTGLAGVYGLQQLSTIDVERIEVVKGAGSALYGSSAVAGAINIITKEPSYEPSLTLDVQLGNYSTNKYEFSSSLKNEKGNIGLNIFAQKLTGKAIDETGPGNTKDETRIKDGISDRVATNLINSGFGLFIDGLFFNDDKLTLRGKTVFEKREGGTMTDDYYRNPLTDGTENISTDRYEAQLSYKKPIGTKYEMNFSMGYVKHARVATNDSFLCDYMDTHDDSVPDLRDMRPYLAEENTLTSLLTFGVKSGNHSILLGMQGFYDKIEESGMYVVVDPESEYLGESYRSVSDKSASEFGAFIQDEWDISQKLTAVPGIRIDLHSSGEEYNTDKQVFKSLTFPKTNFDETSISPRFAVKYEVSDRFSLRANAGSGFRAPFGFSEDLHLCSGSPRVWKSSDLKPEKSLSYNLSADYYGKNIRISTNIFRTDLKNKIGFVDASDEVAALGYDYQWENIDDAFVQGIELSLQANLVRNLFKLGVDFTLNQGKYNNARVDWMGTQYEDDSKNISRFPVMTSDLEIEYNPGTWIFSITGDFQGTMYIDYYNEDIDPSIGDQSKIKKTDPYILFNTSVSRKLNNFKLYAGIKNIFNYLQDEKHLDDAAFMYAPIYGTLFYGGISIEIRY